MFNIDINKDVVFLDIEADHKNNKLIQFGAIKYSNGKYWQVNWYSNPECEISSHVLNLIGKNKLNVISNSENNKIVLAKIFKFIENCYFISFGDFDYTFLNKLFQEYFGTKPNIIEFIDLQKKWKDLLMMETSYSLKDLADFFDINYNEEKLHDAFIDAEILFKIYSRWSCSSNETIVSRLLEERKNSKFNISYTKKIDVKDVEHEFDQGYVLFEITSKKIQSRETNKYERVLLDIRLLSINKDNKIVENWREDLTEKYFNNSDLYNHYFIYSLNRFTNSIKNKKILLYEKQIKDFEFIYRLCKKHLEKRLINSCIIINGIDNLLDFNNENYKNINAINKDLIVKWNIINIIKKQHKEIVGE